MIRGSLAGVLRRSAIVLRLRSSVRAASVQATATLALTTLITVVGTAGLAPGCAADEGSGPSVFADAGSATAAATSTSLTTAIVAGEISTTMPPVALRRREEDSEFTRFLAEGTPWVFHDARGTGTPWALTVSATDFARDGDADDDLAPRQIIPRSALQINLGAVSAEHGADAAPAAEAVTLSDQPQTLIAARNPAKGSYTVHPTFNLRVVKETAAALSGLFVCRITYTMG